jgi:tryptophan synthase alpha subunit
MHDAARLSSGFLYVVSRPGTTGARDRLPDDLSRTVRRARKAARDLPVAIGFGISTPEGARAAARLADGVVVGSALVRAAETAATPREAERSVERLARDLVSACRRTGKAS